MNSVEAREYLINNPDQWCIIDDCYKDPKTDDKYGIYYRWDSKSKRYQSFCPYNPAFNSFNAVVDDGEHRFTNYQACPPIEIDDCLVKVHFWELFAKPVEAVKNYSKSNPELTYDNFISCIKYLWNLD